MFTRKKFGDRNEDCRFQRWHPEQAYTMFAAKKVSERNENCRFQPAYVRKAIAEKSCQVPEIRRA
jgi:hypothetical protein